MLPDDAVNEHPRIPWFPRSPLHLLATLLVVLALPLGLLTGLLFDRAGDLLDEAAVRENELAARLAAEAVDAHVEGLVRHAEAYARRDRLIAAIVADDPHAARPLLRELVDANPYVERAFVSTTSGVLWADWPVAEAVNGRGFGHRDWFVGDRKSVV